MAYHLKKTNIILTLFSLISSLLEFFFMVTSGDLKNVELYLKDYVNQGRKKFYLYERKTTYCTV